MGFRGIFLFVLLSFTLAWSFDTHAQEHENEVASQVAKNSNQDSNLQTVTEFAGALTSDARLTEKFGLKTSGYLPGSDLTHPIYRSYRGSNGLHLMSTSVREGPNNGFRDEGFGFHLFNDTASNRVRVYRCRLRDRWNDHMLSTDPHCEGQITEGEMGYISTVSSPQSPAPLYRCITSAGHRLETLNTTECATRFLTPELLGYTPVMVSGDATISQSVLGRPLLLRTSSKYGGAVWSLVWNGKEFIDSYDHGRLLQSSSYPNVNEWGLCYNPVEAGGVDDLRNNYSTSAIKALTATSNSISTRNQSAYWIAPGDPSSPCPGVMTRPYSISNNYISKTVTVGAFGLSNVIRYDATFDVPESVSDISFEIVTGYMPSEFNHAWTYNLASASVSPRPLTMAEPGNDHATFTLDPVIFSTKDQQYAIATVAFDLDGHNVLSPSRYASYKFPDTTKFNCQASEGPNGPRSYTYTCYLVIGTLSDVVGTLNQLYQNYFGMAVRYNPLYREYRSDTGRHMSTTTYGEAYPTFRQEGVLVKLYAAPYTSSMRPLYRCHLGSSHLTTVSSTCEGVHGAVMDGMLGWIDSVPGAGKVPLYRFNRASTSDHFETTNLSEGFGAGYALDGALGYAPTN